MSILCNVLHIWMSSSFGRLCIYVKCLIIIVELMQFYSDISLKNAINKHTPHLVTLYRQRANQSYHHYLYAESWAGTETIYHFIRLWCVCLCQRTEPTAFLTWANVPYQRKAKSGAVSRELLGSESQLKGRKRYNI